MYMINCSLLAGKQKDSHLISEALSCGGSSVTVGSSLRLCSFLLLQVDRLEVVNKRFVRVIFVPGKSPHEWVSTFNTCT